MVTAEEQVSNEQEQEKCLLTKEDIISIDDVEIRKVFVEKWGRYVYLRNMSAKVRDNYEWEIYQARQRGILDRISIRTLLVSKCLCDAEGNLLFKDKNDVAALAKKNAAALEVLFKEAQDLNGIEREELDEMTENLLEGQSAD